MTVCNDQGSGWCEIAMVAEYLASATVFKDVERI